MPEHDPQIVLVRHGPTTHPSGGWMNSHAVQEWLSDYELSELRPGSLPPESLKRLAQEADLIVSSDAPRAHMSALAIAGSRTVAVDSRLREIPLHIPQLGNVRLPVLGWAIVLSANAKIKGRWTDSREPTIAAQVNNATQLLISKAERHAKVVAVVHANLRISLAEALSARGWKCRHRSHRYAHWSNWKFGPVIG